MTAFPGLGHVAVTVTDLDRSTQWYNALFGTEPVLDEDEQGGTYHHTVWAFETGQLFGIHKHKSSGDGSFDERNAGLDHVGFACADRAALQKWEARLNELGVTNGGIVDAHYGSGLSFRDPDGIALEFFAPPA